MTSERLFNSFIHPKNFHTPPKQISGYAPEGKERKGMGKWKGTEGVDRLWIPQQNPGWIHHWKPHTECDVEPFSVLNWFSLLTATKIIDTGEGCQRGSSTVTVTNHDDQLSEIYPTMLNELKCTFGVSCSRLHCCGRHGIGPRSVVTSKLWRVFIGGRCVCL